MDIHIQNPLHRKHPISAISRYIGIYIDKIVFNTGTPGRLVLHHSGREVRPKCRPMYKGENNRWITQVSTGKYCRQQWTPWRITSACYWLVCDLSISEVPGYIRGLLNPILGGENPVAPSRGRFLCPIKYTW